MTDESLSIVRRFLQRELPSRSGRKIDGGDLPSTDGTNVAKTYRELTSVYHLACDPDGSTNRDYMDAANQQGIPVAFLVGKQGLIEWIGHPMLIDEPLDRVVNDAWDRGKFKEKFKAKQLADDVLNEVSHYVRSSDTKSAVKAIDNFLESHQSKEVQSRFNMIKLQVLAEDNAYFDDASSFALQLLNAEPRDAESANDLAWSIYELAEAGDFEDQKVLVARSDVGSKRRRAGRQIDGTVHPRHGRPFAALYR